MVGIYYCYHNIFWGLLYKRCILLCSELQCNQCLLNFILYKYFIKGEYIIQQEIQNFPYFSLYRIVWQKCHKCQSNVQFWNLNRLCSYKVMMYYKILVYFKEIGTYMFGTFRYFYCGMFQLKYISPTGHIW